MKIQDLLISNGRGPGQWCQRLGIPEHPGIGAPTGHPTQKWFSQGTLKSDFGINKYRIFPPMQRCQKKRNTRAYGIHCEFISE